MLKDSSEIIAHGLAAHVKELFRQSTDETEFYSKLDLILIEIMNSYDDPIEVIRTFATIIYRTDISSHKINCFSRFVREYGKHVIEWDTDILGQTVRYTLDKNETK
jgi:hypothetical protein